MIFFQLGGVNSMSKLDYIVERAEETANRREEMSTEHTDHTNYRKA